LEDNAPFHLDPPVSPIPYKRPERVKGWLLGVFGPAGKDGQPAKPTHVLLVNLDYKTEAAISLVGPGHLEIFDAAASTWSNAGSTRVPLRIVGGGGVLLRAQAAPTK